MNQNLKAKTDLENIVLKQEDKINELSYKVTKSEAILKNKNIEIKQNEDYAIQLMNKIKEQKIIIENIRDNQKIKENDIFKSLKNEIENLKNSIEIKEGTIQTLQKSHKQLQDKYLKLCTEKRKKEQEDLLTQAKEMRVKKTEREKGSFNIIKNNSRNKSNNFNNKLIINANKEDNKNIIPKIDTKSNNINNSLNENYNGIINNNNISNILPVIGTSNDIVKDENNDLSNLKFDISHDDGKIDEINNMMKKIIDEF